MFVLTAINSWCKVFLITIQLLAGDLAANVFFQCHSNLNSASKEACVCAFIKRSCVCHFVSQFF